MLPPENTPALPTPEIARPIMKAVDEGAEADTAEPNAKTRKEVMKIYFMGYSVYNWPKVNTVEQPARRLETSADVSKCFGIKSAYYAIPYQPTSLREPNSSVITGVKAPTQLES
jgi:hypothetical protein